MLAALVVPGQLLDVLVSDNEKSCLSGYIVCNMTSDRSGKVSSVSTWDLECSGEDHDLPEQRSLRVSLSGMCLLTGRIGVDWLCDSRKPIVDGESAHLDCSKHDMPCSLGIFESIVMSELVADDLTDVVESVALL